MSLEPSIPAASSPCRPWAPAGTCCERMSSHVAGRPAKPEFRKPVREC